MTDPSPDNLLYTDSEGNPAQLEDVIDDGLDGVYDDRIPALRRLCETGTPERRLLACRVLVSWGDRVGLETLIRWASAPTETPWADEPVALSRVHGADGAFGLLADALRTSSLSERAEETEALRVEATRALLRLADSYDFDRDLLFAVSADPAVRERVVADLKAAAERAIETLAAGKPVDFDLATQAAGLLAPLARLDDATAAGYADRLLELESGHSRMLRELNDAMGAGSGPATLAVLMRLRNAGDATVREEADRLLARRRAD